MSQNEVWFWDHGKAPSPNAQISIQFLKEREPGPHAMQFDCDFSQMRLCDNETHPETDSEV